MFLDVQIYREMCEFPLNFRLQVSGLFITFYPHLDPEMLAARIDGDR